MVAILLVLRMLLKVLLVLGSKRLDQSRWALGREGQLLDNWCDHRAFPQTISTQIVQLISDHQAETKNIEIIMVLIFLGWCKVLANHPQYLVMDTNAFYILLLYSKPRSWHSHTTISTSTILLISKHFKSIYVFLPRIRISFNMYYNI